MRKAAVLSLRSGSMCVFCFQFEPVPVPFIGLIACDFLRWKKQCDVPHQLVESQWPS